MSLIFLPVILFFSAFLCIFQLLGLDSYMYIPKHFFFYFFFTYTEDVETFICFMLQCLVY